MKINTLVEKFENCTLPKEEWTHEAHLRVVLFYLFTNSFYATIIKTRCGIIRYNASKETTNLCSDKYHETITQFWIDQVSRFITKQKITSLEKAEEALLKSNLAESSYIFSFYSREHLQSEWARAMHAPIPHP